jgi:hypothetical protein
LIERANCRSDGSAVEDSFRLQYPPIRLVAAVNDAAMVPAGIASLHRTSMHRNPLRSFKDDAIISVRCSVATLGHDEMPTRTLTPSRLSPRRQEKFPKDGSLPPPLL